MATKEFYWPKPEQLLSMHCARHSVTDSNPLSKLSAIEHLRIYVATLLAKKIIRAAKVHGWRKTIVFFSKQFTVGFSLRKKRLAAICSRRVSGACPPMCATCPPLVRLVLLALAAPPVLVRHLSALCCWLWPRLHRPCPPCVRHLSACVRHLSALCCWLWPRL